MSFSPHLLLRIRRYLERREPECLLTRPIGAQVSWPSILTALLQRRW